MTWNFGAKLRLKFTVVNRAWGVVAAAGLIALGFSGCGESYTQISKPISTVHPVKGQILLADGKPLTTGVVVLVSTSGQEFPGKLDSDGKFSIKIGDREGAPEGEYVVRLDAEAATTGATGRAKKGTGNLPFPAKYADETTSDVKVTVKPGDNNLEPITLLSHAAAAKSTTGKGQNR
jgi:hypothetical protein